MFLAHLLSEHDQKTRATTIARIVLDRATRTTGQLSSAFERMEESGFGDPCSDESLAQMRQIDLGSSLLQGIGFAEGNELRCSSIDSENATDMGPADYISATSMAIRRPRELEVAAGIPLLIVTAPSGFTGLVHPSLIFEMTEAGEDMPSGVVGYSTRTTLLSSAPSTIDWARVLMPPGQFEGAAILGNQLVAWCARQIGIISVIAPFHRAQ